MKIFYGILKWYILKCVFYILEIKFNKFFWEYCVWKRKCYNFDLIYFIKYNFKIRFFFEM